MAEHGKTLKPAPLDIDRVRFSHVMDSFDLDEITLQDLELRESGEQERVICLNRGELLTEEKSSRSNGIRAKLPVWTRNTTS